MRPVATCFSPKLLGAALIIAPLLFGASTFFWQGEEYGITGGTLLVLSMIFWIPAFMALFLPLTTALPVYSSIGFLLALWGCISGATFGFAGVVLEAFHISHAAYLQAAADHPLAFNLLLFWPGPLFPLSLLVLGIMLLRKRKIKRWAGILICLGTLAFPVSRILRIEGLAHLADLLLAVPLVYLGLQHLFLAREKIKLKEA